MFRGIFAMFFRALRVDSRSVWVHVSWLVLLLVIYIALWTTQLQSMFLGAPGREFFLTVIYLNAIFMTLLGISYFSSAISEERELDTLGLMLMAGISPIGILMGKSTARLFQIFLLLALQYPFTLLAITLGGLMPDQIYAAYAALFAYLMLLANVGLLFSVLSRRNRDSASLTTLWIIAYLFVPLFAWGGYEFLQSPNVDWAQSPFLVAASPTLKPVLLWLSQTSIFGQLYIVTQTGSQFEWTPQLISNSLGGIVCFLLSWWIFPYISHDPATETTSRAVLSRKSGRTRWLGTGRVWGVALAWKDFHFVSGGWFGILSRCGLYIGLYWLTCFVLCPWNSESVWHANWRDVAWGYQIFILPLFTIDCMMCASRVFNDETRDQTLSTLLMLPHSVPDLVYSKIGGCLTGLIPGMIAIVTAFFLLTDSTITWRELYMVPRNLWFAVFTVAHLVLAIHLTALFSLYLRWGALAMAIALTIGTWIFLTVCIDQLSIQIGFSRYSALPVLFATPVVMVCAGCHLMILLRLPALGEK